MRFHGELLCSVGSAACSAHAIAFCFEQLQAICVSLVFLFLVLSLSRCINYPYPSLCSLLCLFFFRILFFSLSLFMFLSLNLSFSLSLSLSLSVSLTLHPTNVALGSTGKISKTPQRAATKRTPRRFDALNGRLGQRCGPCSSDAKSGFGSGPCAVPCLCVWNLKKRKFAENKLVLWYSYSNLSAGGPRLVCVCGLALKLQSWRAGQAFCSGGLKEGSASLFEALPLSHRMNMASVVVGTQVSHFCLLWVSG